MITRDILDNFKLLLKAPSGLFKRLDARPDIVGALGVVDILAFVMAGYGATLGGLKGEGALGLLISFLVLYALMFVVMALMVMGEAAAVWLFAGDFSPGFLSLSCAFAYIKAPVVVSTILYMLLPQRLSPFGMVEDNGPIGALLFRLEPFEIVALALSVILVRVFYSCSLFRAVLVASGVWLLSTFVFYPVIVCLLLP